MNKLFTLIFLFSAGLLNAQTPSLGWAQKIGGPVHDQPLDVVSDSNGNVYVTGNFQGTVDFDPGPGVVSLTSRLIPGFSFYSTDIFVCKYDATGNILWAKGMGSKSDDRGEAIAVDGWGNVYASGYFYDTVDYNPDPAIVQTFISGGGIDAYIWKLSPSGTLIWFKAFSGTGGCVPRSMAVDAQGSVYSAGDINGFCDFDPGPGIHTIGSASSGHMYVCKLDSAGNKVWAAGMPSKFSRTWSIDLDPLGSLVISGEFEDSVDFDPGSGYFPLYTSPIGSGVVNSFVAKYDTSGAFTWAKQMDGYCAYGVATDAFGNVYSTGGFGLFMADFDPGPGTYNLINVGSSDIYISKLNSSGDFVWAKSIGASQSDRGTDIAVDDSCNVYVCGYFRNTVDFNPASSGSFSLTPFGSQDAFTLKLDSSGSFVWAAKAGGLSSDNSEAIWADASGGVYSAGIFEGTADFDPGTGVSNLVSSGATEGFAQKLIQWSSLPVSFISFTGKATTEGNELKWTTASEINNRAFIIEKSIDGRSFNVIGEVAGAGNSSKTLNYAYLDPNPDAVNYYRLRQVDFDGKFAYSNVVMIKRSETIATSQSLTVSPNPASDNITVYYNGAAKQISVTVFDLAGKPLMKKVLAAPATTFDVSGITTGIYVIEVNDGVKVSRVKFVKN